MSLRRPSGILAGLFAAVALAGASPASAAETVSVKLVGERDGKMAIELDKSTVPAGEVTFRVANVAKNTPHEMVVIKVDSSQDSFKPDPLTNKVDESKLASVGEVEGLKAGQNGDLTVRLQPGDYKLICNYRGHVAAGMIVDFRVKGASS